MTMKPYPIMGPWKGVVTDSPSGFDPQAWDTATNFIFRHGRIRMRPALLQLLGAPPDGNTIIGMYSFLDVLQNWHTLLLTRANAYFLTADSSGLHYNQLTLPAGVTDLGGVVQPYAIVEMNQQVYFSNGAQNLMYVDGSANVYLAGDAPGGCKYLTENSGHMIGVNWTIPSPGLAGSTQYPFYVKVSDVGNPQEWQSGLATSAQTINLIEKGGVPTGTCTLGAFTYVWREFGGNALWPTGQAQAPFQNEPFAWSKPGWGNFYPYSLVTWNKVCFFVTHNGEVIQFSGASGYSAEAFQPMADGKVKQQISNDLSLANPGLPVFGFVTDQLGPGYDFQAYVVWIPGLTYMRAWVLNLTDQTWSTWTSTDPGNNPRTPFAFGNIKVA